MPDNGVSWGPARQIYGPTVPLPEEVHQRPILVLLSGHAGPMSWSTPAPTTLLELSIRTAEYLDGGAGMQGSHTGCIWISNDLPPGVGPPALMEPTVRVAAMVAQGQGSVQDGPRRAGAR